MSSYIKAYDWAVKALVGDTYPTELLQGDSIIVAHNMLVAHATLTRSNLTMWLDVIEQKFTVRSKVG